MTRTEQAQEFARDHPYVAFGGLLVPVTFGITGDPMTALFVGGAIAFGPAIAEGFNELQDNEGDAETDDESSDEDGGDGGNGEE